MADRPRAARTRTIRVTLAGLLIVPLVALVGLWAFAASITLGNVVRFQDYTTLAHVTSTSIGSDYVRVDVASESRDAVVGAAVNDVIHLVAELVENATTFSPPTTRVEIRADVVGNGLAVEIEDRGLGLTAAELADINARLARPPEFDLANSDQLGLFVVGRLAARHGIRVSLRESPYGGTTAIMLMPHSVIVREGETRSRTAGGSAQPALAPVPAPGTAAPGTARPGIPLPANATGPITYRERASSFSLTGRHRLEPVPPEGSSGPTPVNAMRSDAQDSPWAVPAAPGGTASRARGPWEPSTPAAPERAGASTPGPDLARRQPPEAAGTHLGLPRRVRQASIVPQLRGHAQAGPAAASGLSDAGAEARSPEDTRSLLSSLQQGWMRGRVDDLDYPDDGPDEWPGGRPGGSPDANDGVTQ